MMLQLYKLNRVVLQIRIYPELNPIKFRITPATRL